MDSAVPRLRTNWPTKYQYEVRLYIVDNTAGGFFDYANCMNVDFQAKETTSSYGNTGNVLNIPDGISLTTGLSVYFITAGNDVVPRDPDAWTLLGSNVGQTWTLIDTMTDVPLPSAPKMMVTIPLLKESQVYRNYRFSFTGNKGADTFQLTDIILWETGKLKIRRKVSKRKEKF